MSDLCRSSESSLTAYPRFPDDDDDDDDFDNGDDDNDDDRNDGGEEENQSTAMTMNDCDNDGDNDGDNDADDDEEDNDILEKFCTQMKSAHSSVRLAMASSPGK